MSLPCMLVIKTMSEPFGRLRLCRPNGITIENTRLVFCLSLNGDKFEFFCLLFSERQVGDKLSAKESGERKVGEGFFI